MIIFRWLYHITGTFPIVVIKQNTLLNKSKKSGGNNSPKENVKKLSDFSKKVLQWKILVC